MGTSATSTSSTTFVNSQEVASITPASTSNKVLVLVDLPLYKGGNQDTNYGWWTGLKRGSTELHSVWNGAQLVSPGGYAQAWHSSFSYLDSPSSTSSLTYQVVLKTDGSTMQINGGGSITLMEIAG